MIALSEACERNKGPILEVLQPELAASEQLLEIGSGTGQHAAWFAKFLPHLRWLPSEIAENLHSLNEYLQQHPSPNLAAPIALEAGDSSWPELAVDAVFTANTLHIMSWPLVEVEVVSVVISG